MTEKLQAVVMAGGEGSRLRPLTSSIPKPMLPVANRPMMEHIILLLKRHDMVDIVATVQFLSSVIRNYFDDGSDLGVSLSYATEDIPLGTAGSVLGARELLSGSFLAISGDALTDLDLEETIAFHRERGAAATMVLKRMQDPLEFGIVMTREDGRIERFLEKPSWGQVFSDTVNTGIYVLEPDVLDLIPPDTPYDFSSELFPAMLDKGLPVFGFITDAYWTDVGNSEAFLQANYDALESRVDVEMPGFEIERQVWVGEDVDIDPSARFEGPALIGDNCRIGAGARLGGGAVIGSNVVIGREATVTGGVVMEGCYVAPTGHLRGGVLGRGVSLDEGATVEEGAVVGDDVSVGSGALIKSQVKIYPSRTVEAGAIVTESLVRERRASRSLFGARGVSGLVNVGLTPALAVRLGMAYGTVLPRGGTVVTGRDASRAARTIKRAIIAGLNSTGVTCQDLELMAMPVTRFAVRSEQAAGGISVRTSPRDPEVVEIRLFDEDGADLPETVQRRIDRVFFREDYRRPGPTKLGDLEFPPHTLEQYASKLLRTLDLGTLRSAGLKVVVDYARGPASQIGPSLIGRLGCEALSVRAYTDEHRPVLVADDLEGLRRDLCDHVRKSGSDLGVLLEPGGEVAQLVDDRGRLVSHEHALLAFVRHEARRGVRRIAVPVSSPSACQALAAEYGAQLEWTPTGLPALMQRAADPDVGFAGDNSGALIFSWFMPAPDGLMTFCKALELVAAAGKELSTIVDELPEVHMASRRVRTPWQQKGAVMRHIASGAERGRLVLLDGVKIVDGERWVLVVPAPDEPYCRVWAEATTSEDAEELAGRYASIVEEVVSAGIDE